MKLSVIIPVYNEIRTIREIIKRVESVKLDKEIIIVDDFSTDGTREILGTMTKGYVNMTVLFHDRNRGKGAALRTGFKHVTGQIVVIQDSDLEYNPQEYLTLIEPILGGNADVVYGSRFLSASHEVFYFWQHVANKFLTLLSNVMTNIKLSDMETCYKVFRRELLDHMTLKSNRFGFEPEFTAKVARSKFRICEVPVSYNGRTYAEGKKINWRDGVLAVFTIIWFHFFD